MAENYSSHRVKACKNSSNSKAWGSLNKLRIFLTYRFAQLYRTGNRKNDTFKDGMVSQEQECLPQETSGFCHNMSVIDVIALVSLIEETLILGNCNSPGHQSGLWLGPPWRNSTASRGNHFGGRIYACIHIVGYFEGRQLYMSTLDSPTSRYAVEKGVRQGAVINPMFTLTLISLKWILLLGVKITLYSNDTCIWSLVSFTIVMKIHSSAYIKLSATSPTASQLAAFNFLPIRA